MASHLQCFVPVPQIERLKPPQIVNINLVPEPSPQSVTPSPLTFPQEKDWRRQFKASRFGLPEDTLNVTVLRAMPCNREVITLLGL